MKTRVRKAALIFFLVPFSAFFFLFLPVSASPSPLTDSFPDSKDIRKAASSEEWLRLCHYSRNFFGGYTSLLDDAAFFFSADGMTDPASELDASVRALSAHGGEGEKARERFPARLQFIRDRFGLHIPDPDSPEFRAFMESTGSDALSVVYSSYYLNNPVSAFGHTFFKLSSGQSPLLDAGINFFADTGHEGFFPYAFKGMAGFYPGKYSVVKFHDKVREYNDSENRDLWVYTLTFDSARRDLFVRHIWELMKTSYHYYFLTQNCAYHTLSALEPSAPECRLTSRARGFVLPIGIVKILHSEGLIASCSYVPSLRNIFAVRYESLTADERRSFHEALRTRDVPESRPVCSALIGYLNYAYPSSALDVLNSPADADAASFRKRIVGSLAARTGGEAVPVPAAPVPPHLIHGLARIRAGGGYDSASASGYASFGFRFSYHDMEDPCRDILQIRPLKQEISI